jgi:hypothetical protein
VFGLTITNSNNQPVSVRLIGEQHIKEDFGGFIPSFQDWMKAIQPAPWMNSPIRLSKLLTEKGRESQRL